MLRIRTERTQTDWGIHLRVKVQEENVIIFEAWTPEDSRYREHLLDMIRTLCEEEMTNGEINETNT